MPSILLDARRVARHRGPRTVLRDVDLRVHHDSRIALVGPNGSGKTTLLRVLAGLDRPDGGEVLRHGSVGHLPQLAGDADGRPARAVALDRLGVLAAARDVDREARRLEAGDLDAIDDHAAALERWLALGGDDAEARLAAGADDVGLPPRLLDRPLATLSGGQAARVGLAVLRASRHDVALLDEPTNHLDDDGLDVLRRVVAEHRGGIVVVSHDRALLEDVATEVVALGDPDAPEGGAVHHHGGFASWEHERAEARRGAVEAHADAVAARDALDAAAEETRRRAASAIRGTRRGGRSARDGDKHTKEWIRMRAQGMQHRAKGMESRAAREIPEKPREEGRLRLALSAAERRAPWIVALEGAVVRRGGWSLGPVDLAVAAGDRVLLAGPNGSGKSTLLAAIAGDRPLDDGVRRVGPGARIATLGQTRAALLAAAGGAVADAHGIGATGTRAAGGEPEGTAAVVARLADVEATEARTALATFGIGAEVAVRPPASLSPGELTRAELAAIALRRTTCLLLDEPTNHLDLGSLAALEAALEDWPGALVVASHDRRFRDALRTTRTVAP